MKTLKLQCTTNVLNSSTGVSAIRLSRSGDALPSTRLVSTTVTLNNSISHNDASFITMQWGQFMDHDLTLTPQFTISKKRLLHAKWPRHLKNHENQVEDAVMEGDSVTSQPIQVLSVCRSLFQVTIPSIQTQIAWIWFVQNTDSISTALHQQPDSRFLKTVIPIE